MLEDHFIQLWLSSYSEKREEEGERGVERKIESKYVREDGNEM